jgi:hypothetical protein
MVPRIDIGLEVIAGDLPPHVGDQPQKALPSDALSPGRPVQDEPDLRDPPAPHLADDPPSHLDEEVVGRGRRVIQQGLQPRPGHIHRSVGALGPVGQGLGVQENRMDICKIRHPRRSQDQPVRGEQGLSSGPARPPGGGPHTKEGGAIPGSPPEFPPLGRKVPSASRTGSCGGPSPCRTSCARRPGCHGSGSHGA